MQARSVRRSISVLLPAVLLLAACGDDDDEGVAAGDLEGRTFASNAVEGQTLVEGTQIALVFDDESGIAAVAGCNTMRGEFDVEDGILVIENLLQTLMACPPDLQAQDEWLAAFLTGGPAASSDGDELTLASDSVTITFADQASAASAPPLDETAWSIASLEGPDGSLTAPEGAYLEYADGTLSVFTGCNRGSASAEAADGVVTVGPMALTMMLCEGDVGEWETALVTFLAGELAYEQDGEQVLVTKGDQTLVLVPLA